MTNFKGLKIISDENDGKARIVKFSIIKKEMAAAIETLIKWLDTGSIITLLDNRDKREGSISLKNENNTYFYSRGGHGFSMDWEAVDIEHIAWLIKATAPFNSGDDKENYGTIKVQ